MTKNWAPWCGQVAHKISRHSPLRVRLDRCFPRKGGCCWDGGLCPPLAWVVSCLGLGWAGTRIKLLGPQLPLSDGKPREQDPRRVFVTCNRQGTLGGTGIGAGFLPEQPGNRLGYVSPSVKRSNTAGELHVGRRRGGRMAAWRKLLGSGLLASLSISTDGLCLPLHGCTGGDGEPQRRWKGSP